MSGGMYGSDVAQLRETASHVNSCAEALAQVRTALAAAVNGTRWEGPDASRFRSEWQGSHSAALLAAENRLREAAGLLQRNASAQETTSAAGGGPLIAYIGSPQHNFELPDETGGRYVPTLPAEPVLNEIGHPQNNFELPDETGGLYVSKLPAELKLPQTDLTAQSSGDADGA